MRTQISLKTSISLDEDTLKAIDNFRRKQEKIPARSKVIEFLILKGLEGKILEGLGEKKEIPKESITEIPKEAIKLENLTIHTRIREGKGGSCQLNLPYNKILEHGLKDQDKINAWIIKKP